MRGLRATCAIVATCALAGTAGAAVPLKALDDGELAAVSGRDGLAFNIVGFSLASNPDSPISLTYTSPASTALTPFTLTLSNFSLSRSDDPSPFTDPYTLDIVARPGLTDVIRLAFPQNVASTQLWQFASDFSIAANNSVFDGGNLQLKDLALKGGGLDISTPSTPGVEGVAFGLSTALSLGSLTIRPRGASDSSEMLTLSGIHLADAVTGNAWALSDITRQPGLFNAVTDSSGTPALHLQINWPTTVDPVPTGALTIDRIAFLSNGVTTDLGSSRIAGIQINYLDVKFRSGP